STEDGTRSRSIARCSAEPSPSTCAWPTKSSSACGRSRCASGASSAARSCAASEKRSLIADKYAPAALSSVWSRGEYAGLAERFAPIHRELVERLRPEPGTRWLDVATGPGGVALLAARAGAEVTGLDIVESMIEQARQNAEAAGLAIRFDVGDAQALPYGDA